MRVGYARVSTTDQSPELQLDALRRAGCERIHTEKASGAKVDRPARSLKKLITTVENLEERGIGLVSLTESMVLLAGTCMGISVSSRYDRSRPLFC
jgi:DNA invertase Pin-like site-specific DNA recombinase